MILGSAKGGVTLPNKNNISVEFSSGGDGIPTVCYNNDNLNTRYEFVDTTGSNTVIGAYINGASNPILAAGVDITTIAIYTYAESDTSGGVFALGVWDINGDLKNESSTFTVADMPVGISPADPTEKITKTITSTTIEDGDTIGIICKTAASGDGRVENGGYDSASVATYWKRSVFVQGSTPSPNANRVLIICVNE